MLSALLDDRRPVYVAGRRFALRKISLADVLRLYALLGSRCSAVTEISVEAGERLLASISRLELAEAISWLMEPADPVWLAEQLTPAALRELIEAVESMNDVRRIFSKLNFGGRPAAPQQESQQPPERPLRSGLEIAIDIIARRYGRPPHEILDWPAEELLSLIDVLDEEVEQLPAAERSGLAPRAHVNDVPDFALCAAGGEVGRKIH